MGFCNGLTGGDFTRVSQRLLQGFNRWGILQGNNWVEGFSKGFNMEILQEFNRGEVILQGFDRGGFYKGLIVGRFCKGLTGGILQE